MEQEILTRLQKNEEKLEKIFISVEKMRRYFLWTLVITVLMVLLPAVGLLFAIPTFMDTYSQMGNIGL
jgi:hypothetical protein